jgi:uncharacterized BrkB/YihY/UPF0761 family membrane protein
MPEEDKCKGCSYRQSCKEVYRELGRCEVPPVTFSVVMAFLLPILIFIAILAAGLVLLKKLNPNLPATAISLALACLVTAVYILVASLIVRKRYRNFDK